MGSRDGHPKTGGKGAKVGRKDPRDSNATGEMQQYMEVCRKRRNLKHLV